MDVVDRMPKLGSKGAYLKQLMRDKLIEHKQYIVQYGDDMPEIREWHWPSAEEQANDLAAELETQQKRWSE
jgi:xylulose-5-phosphate/fructose-6-phosphate phosphoketolase